MLIDRGESFANNVTEDTCNNHGSRTKLSNIDRLLMNISAFSLQGKRSHMEDFFDIGYQLKPDDQQGSDEWPYEYFYFGIFDGHGGCEAAKFAKANLLRMIVRQPDFWSEDDEDILRSIRKGYADTHEAMRKVMHEWPRTHRFLPSTAGTTASILFIKNGKYYTGHVGDSRIVISRRNEDSKQWISKQMTEDHKPESEAEISRIRRAGGDVRSKIGVHRVVWKRPVLSSHFDPDIQRQMERYSRNRFTNIPRLSDVVTYPIAEKYVDSYQIIPFLAIARSLGDFWSINPCSGQYIVSPEPDVACRPIDPNDQCILLATDGLWNVLNSQQAIRALEELKAVREGYRDNGPYAKQYFSTDNFYNVTRPREKDNYALSLVYLAYQYWERRFLRSDNITAVVAMLGDILEPQLNSKRTHYRTRSISSSQDQSALKHKFCVEKVLNSTRSIHQTRIYDEAIRSSQEPTFGAEKLFDDSIVTLERLGNWLMLPPSAVPTVHNTVPIPPKNYKKLEEAETHRLFHPSKGYILVKRVSDDPLDEVITPERTNEKSGVSVRDSSAQCTQSIYDFNRSWCRRRDEEDVEDEEDDDEPSSFMEWIGLDGLEDLDEIGDSRFDDEDEDVDDAEDEDDNLVLIDHVLDKWDDKKELKEESPKLRDRRSRRESLSGSKELMLQPRSDNCDESSKYQRKTRSGAYLSLTGNSKRRVAEESPKTKRRKSHPSQNQTSHSR